MKDWAAGRIEDLKSRGFANAGLYDPPGVGGTHVMYVLQHADRPELYAGLPNDPRISPVVEAWKGVTKYAGLTAIGAFAAIGFLHHIVTGANRVTEHDEEEAKRLADREERMTAHPDVARGDAVHRGDPVIVDRYTVAARINHWITAICLVLLALSGLALFHPSLFFLTGLFGGGQMARILHPWIGVVMFVSFAGPLHPLLAPEPLGPRRTAPGSATPGDVLVGQRGEAARGRQVQRRPEALLLADVDHHRRAVPQRHRDLAAVLRRPVHHRPEADGGVGARARRDRRRSASGSCTSMRRSGCAAPSAP